MFRAIYSPTRTTLEFEVVIVGFVSKAITERTRGDEIEAIYYIPTSAGKSRLRSAPIHDFTYHKEEI